MHGRLCGCKMGQKRLISEEQAARIRDRHAVKEVNVLVQDQLREMAVAELIKKGKLDQQGRVVKS